jgi:hypothetical protein
VVGEEVAAALDDRFREVGTQVALEPVVVGEPARLQRPCHPALRVGEQDRQLGPFEPAASPAALGQLVPGGQVLARPVQQGRVGLILQER